MSGICAVLVRDGGPTGAGPILGTMSHRGPDAMTRWQDRYVTLGHAALRVLPEDEPQPMFHPPSRCAVTADLRLDNREDLIRDLGLRSDVPEAGLILAAYHKWGDDCPRHLAGDFAFVLWDGRAEKLLLARDHLGVKPLAWTETGDIFACASTPAALAAHPELWARLNRGRIADALEPRLEGLDPFETAFTRIRRLPPGHSLTVETGKPRLTRYWSPEPQPTLQLGPDAEYAEAFREIFDQAVAARMRGIDPVGVLVSGGVASGSVAAAATDLSPHRGPVPAFAVTGDATGCAETEAIEASLTVAGLKPHRVTLDWIRQEAITLLALAVQIEDPFDSTMNLYRAAYRTAHLHGVRVMLDAGSAARVFSDGSHLAHLLRAGRWLTAYAAARDRAGIEGGSRLARLASAAYGAWVPAELRGQTQDLGNRIRGHAPLRGSLLSPEFAKVIEIGDRRARLFAQTRPRDLPPNVERARALVHPALAALRERFDRAASRHGIETRDPFLDLRVVRFALSLPADQLRKGGWSMPVVRRAALGRLPDGVAWGRGGGNLGPKVDAALAASWPELDAHLHEKAETWGQWVTSGVGRSFDPGTALTLLALTHFHERFTT